MQSATTAKVKLYPDKETAAALREVCSTYSAACDMVSGYVFETEQYYCSKETMHKQLYAVIRSEYGLKSQLTCSVFRTVKSKYEAVNTKLKDEPS